MSDTDIREERIAYLINRLAESGDYMKIENLADEMFVSRMTLDRLIPMVRQRVSQFGLSLITRPKYGIRLEGGEKLLRMLMLRYGTYLESEEAANLKAEIQPIIQSNGLRISDYDLQSLVGWLVLMIERLQKGLVIVNTSDYEKDHLPRYSAARDEICAEIEERFHLTVPDPEKTMISVHLMVKCTPEGEAEIDPEMLELTDAILDDINIHMGVDFREDENLRESLALHLSPLIYRMKYDLLQQNPLLQMVRAEMSGAFEMAQHAGSVIRDRFGKLITEDETAFIALHFAVAMERWKKKTASGKLLLVRGRTRGSTSLLKWNIQEKSGYREEDVILCSPADLPNCPMEGIECIVTPGKLDRKYPVPVINIGSTGDQDAFDRINQIRHQRERARRRQEIMIDPDLIFSDLSFGSREQALSFLCGKVREKTGIDLLPQVMKRETLASTEVGNGLAVAHPYAYTEENAIFAGMTLKKELFWKYDQVRMVLLIALPYGAATYDYVGDLVGDLATDAKLMKRLQRAFDGKTVQEILTLYYTKNPS